MKAAEKIEKLMKNFFAVKRSSILVSEDFDKRVLDDALAACKETNTTGSAEQEPNIWRIIMNSRITKLAAAAVIIAAVVLSINFFEESIPTAYALQDTIKACSSIRSLHVKEFFMIGQEKRPSEIWIECDNYGRLKKFRLQAPNSGGSALGPLTVVNDGNGSEAWLPNFNLCFRTSSQPDNISAILRWNISDIDPKLVCENLYERQKQGELILDINEPDSKNEPIVLNITYPKGSLSENWMKVIYIDQATRLITKAEKFQKRDGQYQLVRCAEFFDYNRKIKPQMFSLDRELPKDVIWIDQSDKEIGLAQGNMTDKEIADEVTLQFAQANIAKDFNKIGQLYLGVPGFLVEKLSGGNVLKLISIGPAHHDDDPDSNAMFSSCKALTEFAGQYYEVTVITIIVPVSGQPGRWMICGNITSSIPASGKMTISKDNADLNSVTYKSLKPGEFMRKWLILEPIWIKVRGNTLFPSEETQKNEFAAEQIDVAQFEPKITIDEKNYEWLMLECEYGTINLTKKYEDWYLITYAWAQIDMPEEKKCVLGIGSDDAVKVWLNGKLVHQNWVIRGVEVDNDRVPVTFKKGKNQLVLKIQNRGGPWGFCCRLLDK